MSKKEDDAVPMAIAAPAQVVYADAERVRAIRDAITMLEIDLRTETAAHDANVAWQVKRRRKADAMWKDAWLQLNLRCKAQQQKVRDLKAALTPQCCVLGTQKQREALREATAQFQILHWEREDKARRRPYPMDMSVLSGSIIQRTCDIKIKIVRYRRELAAFAV
jgi:hypothetical protein